MIVPRGRAAARRADPYAGTSPPPISYPSYRTGRALSAAAGRHDELSAGGRDLVHRAAADLSAGGRRSRSPTRPQPSRRCTTAGPTRTTAPLRHPPRLRLRRRQEGEQRAADHRRRRRASGRRRRGAHGGSCAARARRPPRRRGRRAAPMAAPPPAAVEPALGRGRTGGIRARSGGGAAARAGGLAGRDGATAAAGGRAARAVGSRRRGASASPRRSGASARRATRPSARPRPRRWPSSSNSRPPRRSGPSRKRGAPARRGSAARRPPGRGAAAGGAAAGAGARRARDLRRPRHDRRGDLPIARVRPARARERADLSADARSRRPSSQLGELTPWRPTPAARADVTRGAAMSSIPAEPRPCPAASRPTRSRACSGRHGLRNRRALIAMIGCLVVGVLVAGLLSRWAASAVPSSALLVWIVAIGTGVNAAGLLQMDHARGISPRSTVDALVYGLMCIPKLIVLGILLFLVELAVFLVIAILLFICKIPFLGPLLFAVVFPVSVVVAGITMLGPLPLHAAVAAGDLAGRDASRVPWRRRSRSSRSRLVEAMLLLAVVWLLALRRRPDHLRRARRRAGADGRPVGVDRRLRRPRLDDGRHGRMGMAAWAAGRRRPRHAIAGAIGVALLWAVAASLVGQVYLLGLSLVYLRVTEGLDLSATEAALRQKLRRARSRASELGEKARAAANRATAPTPPRRRRCSRRRSTRRRRATALQPAAGSRAGAAGASFAAAPPPTAALPALPTTRRRTRRSRRPTTSPTSTCPSTTAGAPRSAGAELRRRRPSRRRPTCRPPAQRLPPPAIAGRRRPARNACRRSPRRRVLRRLRLPPEVSDRQRTPSRA